MPWKPGESGNIKGRPRESLSATKARTLARQHTEKAIATLVEVMESGDKDSARVAAAQSILDRGFGRAPQEVTDLASIPEEALVAELRRRLSERDAAAAAGVGDASGGDTAGSH